MWHPACCMLAQRGVPLLAARVRPAHAFGREHAAASSSAITSVDEAHVAVHAAGRDFPVDVQLWGSDQEQAWRALGAPLVATVLSGVSATLLVHGCAGAGKTFTVSGHGIVRAHRLEPGRRLLPVKRCHAPRRLMEP